MIAQIILLMAALVTVSTRQFTGHELVGATDIMRGAVISRSVAMMLVAVILAVKSVMARVDREAIENYIPEEESISNTLEAPLVPK